MEGDVKDLKLYIRDVPNFPKPGIIFRDITPLLADGEALHEVIDRLSQPYRGRIDMVLGIESRGFLFGAAVAYALSAGLAVVRKPGKLPAQTYAAQYALEYGRDALEIHRDAFGHPTRVLIVDDLLATGGTAQATAKLAESLGAQIAGLGFVVELEFLKGREKLKNYDVMSLLRYDK